MKAKLKLKKNWWIHVIAVVCVLFVGLVLEYGSNHRELSMSDAKRQMMEVPGEQITYQGFEEKDGKLLFLQDYGVISLDLGGQYVGKFGYTFEYDGLLNVDIYAGVHNIYGEARERDELHIRDRNSKLLSQSWVRIGEDTDYIHLVVRQADLQEKGLDYIDFSEYPLLFTGFYVNNQPSFHWQRLLFYWCVLGLAVCLWMNRDWFGHRVEQGFLLIALSVGILLVIILPVNKVSWDEEVHFKNAFWLASYPKGADVSDAVLQQFSAGIDTWPFNQPSGQEEQQLLNEYWNENGDYRTGKHHWSEVTDKTTFQGYAGSVIMLIMGKLLHLPFALLFRLGRLGNLLVYCGLMFFAIKLTPVGKGIMAFLGLMPTPMFLASVYSYDPFVTGCLYLTFAWILKETLDDGKKINWKHALLFGMIFFLGCRTKAVYAPLGLLILMIPKEKYVDKRQQYLIQGGGVLLVLMLLASFLLPTLISPSETGDLRGGATSEVGQMAYVLGQPLAYTWILIKNIWNTLPGYVLGEDALGTLGHLGEIKHTWMLYAGTVLVILTNTQIHGKRALNGKQKLWILTLIGAAAVLIWTAMYMAYTVPGETFIGGVQGRYYIPFLCLVYLLLSTRRVVVHIPQKVYYTGILAMSAVILLVPVYEQILRPYCF
ncbi:MAG: DUF2142 domain-containing protein [Lachnospiraceae bacterium]